MQVRKMNHGLFPQNLYLLLHGADFQNVCYLYSMKRFFLLFLVLFTASVSAQPVFTFTPCGKSGRFGPTQFEVDTNYGLGNPLFNQVRVNTTGFQEWAVPGTNTYRIVAFGAQGGTGASSPNFRGGGGAGGLGARMQGDFNLNMGDTLVIAVGQRGTDGIGNGNCGGGGGGGTFVWKKSNGALLMASGGGGGGPGTFWSATAAIHGDTNSTGQVPPASQGYVSGAGGTGGGGGGAGSQNGNTNCGYCGAGGAGWTSNGGAGGQYGDNYGRSRSDGFVGGRANNNLTNGGFGGGAATGDDGRPDYSHGNAGGGGYSGGAGTGYPYFGGGGGSFNAGTNRVNARAFNSGHGKVEITIPICQGVPNSPLATINNGDTVDFCGSLNAVLQATNTSAGSGYSVIWQKSNSFNGPWSDIPGSFSVVYTYQVDTFSTYFRVKATCSGSGDSAFSNVVLAQQDTLDPVLSTPPSSTVVTNAGQCYSTNVLLIAPQVTDNCGPSTLTNNAPAQFPLGQTIVVWTATDAAGNSATVNQNVFVQDLWPPVVTPPANVTVFANNGQCFATGVSLGQATAVDNCSPFTLTNNAPAVFNAGQTVVVWTATDSVGNVGTAQQIVTVVDNQFPVLTIPANLSVNANAVSCGVSGLNLGSATASDNCTGVTITNNAPQFFNPGSTWVVWSATDPSGNTTQDSQLVVVNDVTAPQVQAPANLVLLLDSSSCLLTNVNLGTAQASDNCSLQSVTNNAPAGFGPGQTLVVWTATDVAGNTAIDTQMVMVYDSIAPVAIPPANIVVSTDASACSASNLNLGTPTTQDNCSVTQVQSNAPPVFPLGTTQVVWSVSDAAGNTTQVVQTVLVVDSVPPTFANCKNETGFCLGQALPNYTPQVSDACSAAQIQQVAGPASGTVLPAGTADLVWEASDAAGNVSTCTTSVVVNTALTAGIQLSGDTLTATVLGDSLIWLRCSSNFSVVPGANSATFVPQQSGSYAAVVYNGYCADTSDCIQVNPSSIDSPELSQVRIYPVPATQILNLELELKGSWILHDLQGKRCMYGQGQPGLNQLSLHGLATGSYLLSVEQNGRRVRFRVPVIR